MLQLKEGHIALEYSIPRVGKRIDAVLIIRSCVILLEFKVFETAYPKSAVDQVVDYALDLHNFHEASHTAHLFPFLVCTEASENTNAIKYPAAANVNDARRAERLPGHQCFELFS